jgi:hypothetical protein
MPANTEHFYTDKRRWDGLTNRCILCRKEEDARNRGNWSRPKRLAEWKRRSEYSKKWKQRVRLEALSRYGGDPPRCACCGENALEFLSLDHTNGGGCAHRRALKKPGGFSLSLWLRQRGFPDGFRVLCHNCNQAIGFYGYCPHQRVD